MIVHFLLSLIIIFPAIAGEAEVAIIMDSDNDETAYSNGGPTMENLVAAILSNRSIIITNISLVETIVARKKRFYDMLNNRGLESKFLEKYDSPETIDDLYKKFTTQILGYLHRTKNNSDPYGFSQLQTIENSIPHNVQSLLYSDFLCALVPDALNDLIFYRVKNSPIVVCIPQSYFTSKLRRNGIKLDNLKKFDTFSQLIKEQKAIANPKKLTQSILEVFEPDTTADVKPLPRWDIFMQGHGSSNGSYIAGLPQQTFYALIKAFNTRIHTRFLYYLTCYSGGTNLNKLLTEIFANNDNSFTIATNVAADIVTYCMHRSRPATSKECWIPKQSNFQLPLSAEADLSYLFDGIDEWYEPYKKDKPRISISQLIRNFTDLKKPDLDQNFVNFKQPYSPYFSSDERDPKIFFITPTMGQRSKSIVIPKTALHIFFDSSFIPADIEFSSNAEICTTETTLHLLNKVTINGTSKEADLFKPFSSQLKHDLTSDIVFFIKELSINDTTSPYKLTKNNVIIALRHADIRLDLFFKNTKDSDETFYLQMPLNGQLSIYCINNTELEPIYHKTVEAFTKKFNRKLVKLDYEELLKPVLTKLKTTPLLNGIKRKSCS